MTFRHHCVLPSFEKQWYKTAPLRIVRSLITGLTLVSLLSVSAALAAQTCEEIQQKQDGGAEYQRCIQDRRKTTIDQQVETYKETLDRRRLSIESNFESLRNEEDYAWKDTDLQLEYQIEMKKMRIDEHAKTKEVAEELEMQRGELTVLEKTRDLLRQSHDQKKKRFDLRRDSEIHELDAALTDEELSLWQEGSNVSIYRGTAWTDTSTTTTTHHDTTTSSFSDWSFPSQVDLHLFGD